MHSPVPSKSLSDILIKVQGLHANPPSHLDSMSLDSIPAWSYQRVPHLLFITLDFYTNITMMVTFNNVALEFSGELVKGIATGIPALNFQ